MVTAEEKWESDKDEVRCPNCGARCFESDIYECKHPHCGQDVCSDCEETHKLEEHGEE